MTPLIRTKAYTLGCSFLLMLLLVAGLLAWFMNPLYWVGFGVVLAASVVVILLKDRADHNKIEFLMAACFDAAQGRPVLKSDLVYAFPHFTLTYPTEKAMQESEARGEIDKFREGVAELYAAAGTRNNPFDASMAVHATFKGWQPTAEMLHRSDLS